MPKRKTSTQNKSSSSDEMDTTKPVDCAADTKMELVNAVVENTQEETETKLNNQEENDEIGQQFVNVLETLSTFRQSITALQTQIRLLEKSVRKDMKSLRREANKHRSKGNRKPSGFAKPSLVTAELCKFMGKDEGTEIARTEVTQYLIQYNLIKYDRYCKWLMKGGKSIPFH